MDFYFGNGMDDLVVPKDGELPDRLPSPDSWFKWGMNAPESFESGNKYFVMDSDITHEELNFNGKRSSYDVEMGASEHSKDRSSDSSVGGTLTNSLQRSAFSHGQPDYQLDDFPGIEQMDDIFLSSLLEDIPVIENFHKSVCISSLTQSGTKPAESVLTYAVDSHESSKYARTDGIYTPGGWEDRKVIPCGSEQKDHPPVKLPQAEHCSFSEENSTSGYVGEETSLEESVLQDLEIVLTQLTEKTRICFRDALYRLAKSSKQHVMADSDSQIDNRTGDILMEDPPPWTGHDNTIRSERKQTMESETNTIDRAVANLMFSEMESNSHSISMTAPANLKQEVAEASGSHSYCLSQADYSVVGDKTLSGRDAQVPGRDAQGPIHGHNREMNSCTSSMQVN